MAERKFDFASMLAEARATGRPVSSGNITVLSLGPRSATAAAPPTTESANRKSKPLTLEEALDSFVKPNKKTKKKTAAPQPAPQGSRADRTTEEILDQVLADTDAENKKGREAMTFGEFLESIVGKKSLGEKSKTTSESVAPTPAAPTPGPSRAGTKKSKPETESIRDMKTAFMVAMLEAKLRSELEHCPEAESIRDMKTAFMAAILEAKLRSELEQDAQVAAAKGLPLVRGKPACRRQSNPPEIEIRRVAQAKLMSEDPDYATRTDSPQACIAFYSRYDMELWRNHGCICERMQVQIFDNLVVAEEKRKQTEKLVREIMGATMASFLSDEVAKAEKKAGSAASERPDPDELCSGYENLPANSYDSDEDEMPVLEPSPDSDDE